MDHLHPWPWPAVAIAAHPVEERGRGGPLLARELPERGPHPHDGPRPLQDEPAHVGAAQPGTGARSPQQRRAAARVLRALARARADRAAVPTRRAARGPRRPTRGLRRVHPPHAALPQQHRHGLRGGGDGVEAPDRLRALQPERAGGAASLPRRVPRSGSGTGALSALAGVEQPRPDASHLAQLALTELAEEALTPPGAVRCAGLGQLLAAGVRDGGEGAARVVLALEPLEQTLL